MIQQISRVLIIVLLSLVASLGTGLGGLIAVIHVPGKRLYGFLMGIAAGVMICLSFLELLNEAWEQAGFVTTTLGFGAGASFMLLLDYFAPHMRFGEKEVRQHPEHAPASTQQTILPGRRHRFGRLRRQNGVVDQKLINTGLLLAIGITLHNLPEGIAVGAGYLYNPQFGVFIAMAILLHNIPEGIATALPLCKGGVCRSDALRVAFLSGMAEPVGALSQAFSWSNFKALFRLPWHLPGALWCSLPWMN